jgi:hypothetical protein
LKQSANLAMTEPEFFVCQGDRRVNIGSELNRGCSGRIGRLQFMSSLNATATTAADARIDIELPVDDGSRNLSLVLDDGLGLFQLRLAAIRASFGKRDIVGFVNGLWRSSSLVFAVIVAFLAAGFLRQWLAILTKGRGLPFAFSLDFFKSLFQPLDLFLLLLDDFQQQLALRAVGIDLGHIHDPTSMFDSCRIRQDQFHAR